MHELKQFINNKLYWIWFVQFNHIVGLNIQVRSLVKAIIMSLRTSQSLLPSPIRLLLYLPLAVCLSLPASQKTPLFFVLYPGHPTPFLNTQVVHSLSSSSSPWSACLIDRSHCEALLLTFSCSLATKVHYYGTVCG